MKSYVTLAAISVFVAGGLLLSSCSKDKAVKEVSHGSGEHVMTPDWKFTLPQGNPAAGRELFIEMECYKCHEIKGESFPAVTEKDKGVGPELSQMASSHPVEFFAESIINPNAVIDPEDKKRGFVTAEGRSKMPTYNDVLTIKQVVDIASYLASLKNTDVHEGH